MALAKTTHTPSVLIIAGAALLGAGFYFQFSGSTVSSADQLRCEQTVRTLYADNNEAQQTLLSQCQNTGFVTMMDARVNGSNAAATAQAIASANQSESGSIALGYGAMGIGLVLLIAGFANLLRNRNK